MTAEPRDVEEIREIAERYLYDGDNDRPLNDGYLRLAHVADRLAAGARELTVELKRRKAIAEQHRTGGSSLTRSLAGRESCTYDDIIRLVAALSAAPQPEHADDCPGCTSGTDDHDVRYWNQPPASDEPARCEHGIRHDHVLWRGVRIDCPGPAASGPPDGGS